MIIINTKYNVKNTDIPTIKVKIGDASGSPEKIPNPSSTSVKSFLYPWHPKKSGTPIWHLRMHKLLNYYYTNYTDTTNNLIGRYLTNEWMSIRRPFGRRCSVAATPHD